MAATHIPLNAMPTTVLHGVGARFAQTLEKLAIRSVQDLLFHLPYRYIDRSRVRSIASLRMNDMALVHARVLEAKIIMGRRRSLMIKVEDASGSLSLRFFHFNAAQKNAFEAGRKLSIFGEARIGASGLEFYHPETQFLDDTAKEIEPELTLTPIYHLTDGLTQPRIRGLATQAIVLLEQHSPEEWLPASINQQFGVDSLAHALKTLHFPPADADQASLLIGKHPYQQRLAFEELLAHFFARQSLRQAARAHPSPAIPPATKLLERFLDALPFAPTGAQARVFSEIQHDIQACKPMLRMVQGDVGSGKTLVAALAALNTIGAQRQVALVAPTEILAEQHYKNFCQWLEPLNIRVAWLVGKLSPKAKAQTCEKLLNHECDIVIGTHALFEDKVQFASLGLVIIDEQHRFGVSQRLSMRQKSTDDSVPHQLVMTATPIPRTLAMTHYSELDFSIIDELPPGRTPVNTAAIRQDRKEDVISRIRVACSEGRQCYWVCPLIEESETLSIANAEETYATLQEHLPELSVLLIHGRLKAQEKEQLMAQFKQGEAHILVATTVIEVGVDVPNASVMVIENPERLGLAQLHQLRGRVGRGIAASHCILLYGEKLSRQGRERLQILRETNDGFLIAEKDLKMRGPGEFLGTRQAGDMLYRLADHQRDQHLFEQVQILGLEMLSKDPLAAEALVQRWIGDKKDYALA